MQIAQLVGWLATCASTLSFIPQAWKIVRTRRTADISSGMYALTVLGFSLWAIYGVMLGAWPLVATNTICFSVSGFILGMKLLPRRGREKIADTLDPTPEDAAGGRK